MEYFRNIYPNVEYVNQQLQNHQRIIIFDTETEGLEEDKKIIQFSGVLYDIKKNTNGYILNELENFNVYINPERKLDPIITELTGITDEMLVNAYNEKETISKIIHFMEKADLWAAYNAKFDLNKLKETYRRTGVKEIWKDCIDVFEMAKNIIHKADIKNHKLGTVTGYLCPNYEAKFHDSLEDVRATGKVLEILATEYDKIKTPVFPDKTIKVDSVSYWKNPNMGSMRRLTIWSNRKNTGIFWDCKNKCFSCNSKKEDKLLFKSINLPDIENQILSRYGKKYQCNNMDDLGRIMENEWNEKERKKEEIQKNTIKNEIETQDDEIEFL